MTCSDGSSEDPADKPRKEVTTTSQTSSTDSPAECTSAPRRCCNQSHPPTQRAEKCSAGSRRCSCLAAALQKNAAAQPSTSHCGVHSSRRWKPADTTERMAMTSSASTSKSSFKIEGGIEPLPSVHALGDQSTFGDGRYSWKLLCWRAASSCCIGPWCLPERLVAAMGQWWLVAVQMASMHLSQSLMGLWRGLLRHDWPRLGLSMLVLDGPG